MKLNLKPVGRFLKKHGGKIIGGLTGIAVATPQAGIQDAIGLDPVTALIGVAAGVLIYLVGLFNLKPGTKALIGSIIRQAGEDIGKAIQEDSEGGRKITSNEIIDIAEGVMNKMLKER